MRVDSWEIKLNEVIEKTKNIEKFEYGKNDCITFTLQCIEAITGKKVLTTNGSQLNKVKKSLKNSKKRFVRYCFTYCRKQI